MSMQPLTAVVPSARSSFLSEARAGLLRSGQKSVPPKYFYDALGSSLFEAITQLPNTACGVPSAACWKRTQRKLRCSHRRRA